MLHADGQAAMTKLIVALLSFVKAPKNGGLPAEFKLALLSLLYFYYDLCKIHLIVSSCSAIIQFSLLP
jgi:hypothetical protein